MASLYLSGGTPLPTPVLLVGTHVRFEPLTSVHEADLYEAGQAPEIWTYLPTPHAPFLSREAARHWMDEAFAQQATGGAGRLPSCGRQRGRRLAVPVIWTFTGRTAPSKLAGRG